MSSTDRAERSPRGLRDPETHPVVAAHVPDRQGASLRVGTLAQAGLDLHRCARAAWPRGAPHLDVARAQQPDEQRHPVRRVHPRLGPPVVEAQASLPEADLVARPERRVIHEVLRVAHDSRVAPGDPLGLGHVARYPLERGPVWVRWVRLVVELGVPDVQPAAPDAALAAGDVAGPGDPADRADRRVVAADLARPRSARAGVRVVCEPVDADDLAIAGAAVKPRGATAVCTPM